MHECVRSEGVVAVFPAVGGWERFKPAHLSRADAMLHCDRVEAEDSSSGSDTDTSSREADGPLSKRT